MFLRKLKVEPPYDPATPLLGIYSKELKAEICILKFTAVLFTTPYRQKQHMSSDAETKKQNVI